MAILHGKQGLLCDKKFSERVENTGKRRNCSLQAISPFPAVFPKDSFYKHVKTRACLGRG